MFSHTYLISCYSYSPVVPFLTSDLKPGAVRSYIIAHTAFPRIISSRVRSNNLFLQLWKPYKELSVVCLQCQPSPSIVAFVWLYAIARSLDVTHVFVGTISEEHEELQRLHRCKNNEREGVVMKLQSQLSGAHDELDKIRRSLRTLKAADGHGLGHIFFSFN